MDDVLVIDDLRVFEFEAIYARTSASAIEWLRDHPCWKEVWWDFDLGLNPWGERVSEDTSIEVLKYLEARWWHNAESRGEIGSHNIVTNNPSGERLLATAFERWEVPYRRRTGRVNYSILGVSLR